jgi:AcrR family transcriptional regulator
VKSLSRETVVDAARAQIVERGLAEFSLRQVGAALGVTAPALYAYVTDKTDLLRAVATFELGQLLGRFELVVETDPVARVRRQSRIYVDYAVENPELFKAIFLFPPALEVAAPTGDELPTATLAFNYATDSIGQAIDNGAFRADLDPLLATFTSWTMTHGLATVLLLGFAFDEPTREVLIDTVLDAMIRSLSP